jgi:hypothetical protein
MQDFLSVARWFSRPTGNTLLFTTKKMSGSRTSTSHGKAKYENSLAAELVAPFRSNRNLLRPKIVQQSTIYQWALTFFGGETNEKKRGENEKRPS